MGCEFPLPDPMASSAACWNEIMLTYLWRELRHVDLKGNLIKAMMVLNWLNMLEVENF